ncbi:SGNH/GDSL hydrolase family protein, partial [Coleofasciculus sp. FACHB-712]
LRIREGNYRVINAAVPGYTSGNELAGLALQILPYQPDAIVVLNGYADLMLPSTENETNIPYVEKFLNNAAGHLWFDLTQDMKRWLNQTYLVKATQYWVLKPQPTVEQLTMAVREESVPLAQRLPANTTELERRVKRYQNHQTQMVRLTAAAQIPLVLVVQPEITGRSTNNLSLRERELLSELGSTYTQRVQAGYGQLDTKTGQLQRSFPQNVKVLNFYKLYQNFPGQAFSDAIHLTDEANTVMADRLYKTFLELPRLQIQPAKQPQ